MTIEPVSLNTSTAVSASGTSGALAAAADAAKLEDAARQFEALLMAELLKVSRGEDSGWLGTGEDTSMSPAMDMAQEYFAQAIAAGGGVGITEYVKDNLVPREK